MSRGVGNALARIAVPITLRKRPVIIIFLGLVDALGGAAYVAFGFEMEGPGNGALQLVERRNHKHQLQ